MSSLKWERMLDTCLTRDATDLLLTLNSPPMIRLGGAWRPLQTAPLNETEIERLASERLSTQPQVESERYVFSDFTHGEAAHFRLMAFGYPKSRMLLVSRRIADSNPNPN